MAYQPPTPTDEQLALKLQAGNGEALTLIVDRYQRALIGYLARLCYRDWSNAEDMAQETLLQAVRAIHQYQYPRPFKAWLYAIATNIARNHYRRADTRFTVSVKDEDLEMMQSHVASPEVMPFDTVYDVAMLLNTLPFHQREVVILRYYEDLSLHEIATMLHIPLGTVKSRLSLGLKQLRHAVEGSSHE